MERLIKWLWENPGLSVSISVKPDTDVNGIPVFEVTMDDLRPVETSRSKRPVTRLNVNGIPVLEVTKDDPRPWRVSTSKRLTTHQDVLYTDFGPDFRGTLDRMKERIESPEERSAIIRVQLDADGQPKMAEFGKPAV